MKQTDKYLKLWSLLVMSLFILSSCGSDDDGDGDGGGSSTEPIASFTAEVDEDDWQTVILTNNSLNATSYSWDLGDGNTSTDEELEHTYAEAGDYTITLTASADDQEDGDFSRDITITNPETAATLLAGTEASGKTWKLFREGTCLAWGNGSEVGSNSKWSGLSNNGARPCLYEQTFTFTPDGDFIFDDQGSFWAEYSPWLGTDLHETCFVIADEADGMVNLDDADVSDWGSGTHSYEYDVANSEINLTGMGAWIGFVNVLGNDETSNIPTASRTVNVVNIEQFTGYDLMTLTYVNSADIWTCVYVSYSDESLEPDVETEEQAWGEDYDDIAPTVMSHSFATSEDFVVLGDIDGGSLIQFGVDDPTDGSAPKVGQFDRVAVANQEAKFNVNPEPRDIDFSNMNTLSLDVYLPSANDYTGTLTHTVSIGIADQSATEQWWTDIYSYTTEDIAEDTWVTLSYDIDTPTTSNSGGSPLDRTDLDMIFISIGSGGHTDAGTFYIRNLEFSNVD